MRAHGIDAANAVTAARIIGAAGLLLVAPFGVPFFAIYTACGATDMLDGYIARRFAGRRKKAAVKRGAALDSIADFVLVGVMLYICAPGLASLEWAVWAACGIGAVRIASGIVCFVKFKRFAWLHTYLNKAAGLALFSYVYLQKLFGMTAAIIVVAAICALAAVEELIIALRSHRLDVDVRGLFFE